MMPEAGRVLADERNNTKEAAHEAAALTLQNPFISELDRERIAAFSKVKPNLLDLLDKAPALPSALELKKQIFADAAKSSKDKDQTEKTDIKLGADREQIISKLPELQRKELELLRLELSLANKSNNEADKKTAAIKDLLDKNLPDEIKNLGYADLLSQRPLNEILSEARTHRPAEFVQLTQELRLQLLQRAAAEIKDEKKLESFKQDLLKFESRAAKQSLPDYERLETLLQISRVLDPQNAIVHGEKSNLARAMLHNAASPSRIDQGGHNTCNVTSFQVRFYAQEPGRASRVVADTALSGQYKTADGTIVKPLSLAPDGEAKQDPTHDGSRNYASQIFQMVAINSYWNRRDTLPGGKTVGKGMIQYAQDQSGEFLLDTSVNPPRKQQFSTVGSDHPWLDVFGVSEVAEQLSGTASKNFGIKRWVHSGERDGVSMVVTLAGFKEKLAEYKKANAFPVVVEVDSAKKPFGNGKGFGPHMVSILDYDPESELLTVDNQWGSGADMTGQEGQMPKASAAVFFSSMSLMPSFDYLYEKAKDGLKQVEMKDAIAPSITAASVYGLKWGLSSSAPQAVRSGLGQLNSWGLPYAGSLLSASQTRTGAAVLRGGSSLTALAAFAYMNDLPGAFREGNAHGVGKLTRVTGDWASFEIGRGLSSKVVKFVPWAPARFGLSVAAGMATTAVFDKLLGEGAEIGGSWAYDHARDYLTIKRPLPEPSRPERTRELNFELKAPKLDSQIGKPTMSTLFLEEQRYRTALP